MRSRRRRTQVGAAVVLLVLCVGLVTALVVYRAVAGPRTVTVMTRNLYIGADITRPIRAAAGRTGPDAVLALGHANHELRRIVDRTDFATRSGLLADEIAKAQPDVLGLQEVALWRHGPMELNRLGQLNATTVDYDFLQLLLGRLADRGLSYEVAGAQQGSDVEAPAFTGDPFAGTVSAAQDVRLTVRDVILVHRDAGIRVLNSGGGSYRHRLDVTLGGVPFSFVRGFSWADVTAGSFRFRFVTTQLESQSADIALAQAAELLGGPAADASISTVIVCDCNSDPANTRVPPGDSVPKRTAYQLLTGDGRFGDLWLQQQPPRTRGFTAGLNEPVNDATPAALNRRLDLALARPAGRVRLPVRRADVTGDELTDRDMRTGLWPSDHAGVVVSVRTG
jgi:endonuclease/exonuclease/phosphatase family metal-dependent hydrolase